MKYTKFSKTPQFYEGCATAYCTECNLDCLYCFSQNSRNKGKELKPDEVAKRLIKIAQRWDYNKVRISGGEATLDFDHTYEVIKYIMENSDLEFILETNGVLLGQNDEMIKKLAEFNEYKRLTVRVSIKHVVPEFYAVLTQKPKDWMHHAPNAIVKLLESNIWTMVGIMEDWFSDKELDALMDWLAQTPFFEQIVDLTDDDDELEELQDLILSAEGFVYYPSAVPYKKSEIQQKLFSSY